MSHLDLRCSAQTLRLGESPAGTAGVADLVLLLQLPLPWPSKVDAHPSLAALTQPGEQGLGKAGSVNQDLKVQILAVAPAAGVRSDPFHIIGYYKDPDKPFRQFERFEVSATADTWLDTVQGLTNGEAPGTLGGGSFYTHAPDTHAPDIQPSEAQPSKASASNREIGVVDLLVCTHGSRDRCCGQAGTVLFLEVENAVQASEDLTSVRVWRTSHIGGHRFAPTALTLPDGMTWAGLDLDSTLGILRRSLAAKDAARQLRGTIGLPSGPAQIADGLAFGELGWSWLASERAPSVTTIPTDGFGISDTRSANSDQEGTKSPARTDARAIKTATVSSAVGSITVVLKPSKALPVPPCGESLDQATKSVAQWEITSANLTLP